MLLSGLQYVAGALTGVLVGFSLGLVGGGGSLLAVPLMVYAVGVDDPHLAVGTSALAVAANALMNLVNHARSGTVRWPIAGVFAAAGAAGAWLGSLAGEAIAGATLLALFAVLMLVVGILMLRGRSTAGCPDVRLDARNAPKLLVAGGASGALSGFFGIGGGFLIVPALMYAARLPILQAVGSSLVAVTVFAVVTTINYARSGWILWPLAAVFIAGGALGGLAGTRLARRLSPRRGALQVLFALLLFLVAGYILWRSVGGPANAAM